MTKDLENASQAPPSRAKKYLWIFAGLVVAVGGAYGGGRLQTQSELDALGDGLTTARHELQASTQLQASQRQELAELEARRRMHLAIIELDQNNFGTAQEHLRAGAALLQAPASADVAALGAAMRTLELAPSVDLAAQRQALLQLASKFDALRPPMLPPSPSPSP
jgi:hypothetical protein